MKLEGERTLLRIHVDGSALHHARPVYEELVDRARRAHLAGATVLRGRAGFLPGGPLLGGHAGAVHVAAPVIVELVDEEEKLMAFAESVAELLRRAPAIVTAERAHVAIYRSRGARGPGNGS